MEQFSWLRYFDRSYQQIKDRVLLQLYSRVPEITDHTEGNIYVKMLSIWAGIAEMLGYYIDNIGREAYIETCRLWVSAAKLARQYDYQIKACTPASADIKFLLTGGTAFNTPFTIPLGTVLETDDGIQFRTTEDTVLPAYEPSVLVPAVQYSEVLNESIGNSIGGSFQEIIIGTGFDVVHNSVVLRVDGVAWTPKETLAYSLPADTHYVVTVNLAQQVIATFGDGMNGKRPIAGQLFEVDYRTTQGAAGNVDANTITTLVTGIALPPGYSFTVTNTNKASAGTGVESLAALKRRLPLSLRTMLRMVTKQDHIDVTEIAAGVYRAGVLYNCGKTIEIFIVPEGGGIASSPLVDSTFDFVNPKRMIGTNINVFPAGEVEFLLSFGLVVKPGYQQTLVVAAVKAALIDFLSYVNQFVFGEVHLSDLYDVIESTEGVSNSDITLVNTKPYARPLNEDTIALDWQRETLVGSTTNKRWKIVITTVTDFQLFRDNTYVGTFAMGALVNTFPEITFQFNVTTYDPGMSWEFWTYPYNGNTILLQEPSVPVAQLTGLTVTATGGL